ncbi:MAG: putative quinol monooxygenase [Luteibaculaceae bacterium]
MIHRWVRLTINPTDKTKFLDILREYHHNVRAFPGCKSLLLSAEPNGNVVITYSVWDDEASLAEYRRSEMFKAFWLKIKPFFIDKPLAYSTKEVSW